MSKAGSAQRLGLYTQSRVFPIVKTSIPLSRPTRARRAKSYCHAPPASLMALMAAAASELVA